jgi:glycosyltransferase involved in cell wall biosynthesis
MNHIKLSICIATRNRGAFIGTTLESVICQATDDVEIVILDGASTDNTEEIVRSYRERFPRMRYERQELNLGIDRDFARAVDLAQGEYCWLFCDDDVFKPSSIRIVLEATKENYALIVVDSEVRNADLSQLLLAKRMQLNTDRVYKPNELGLLLADAGDYLSFIGGVVIKRELWVNREKEIYFGSSFIHVGVIFQRPLPGDVLVISESLISIRYGNASWVGKTFEIFMFNWPQLIWSFVDLPDSAKSRVCSREPWRSIRTLLHLRAKGAYTKREYNDLLVQRLKSRWARLISKIIAHFPGCAANLTAFIYYSALRRPSSLPVILLDLKNSPFYFWKLPMRPSAPFKVPVQLSTGSRLPARATERSD